MKNSEFVKLGVRLAERGINYKSYVLAYDLYLFD